MSKNYDEQVNFIQGGDDGQNTSASIQPIAAAENLWEDPLNRSPENLRKRTEVLRNAINELKYYSDYDRSLILRSDALFTFTEPVPGQGKVLNMSGDDLWIYPTLTPGRVSGGRDFGAKMFTQQGLNWVPYAGTIGSKLIFVASSQFIGMRGYADGDNFAIDTNSLSLGGNRLTITLIANPLIAGGVGTMTVTVTGSPATQITITYGTLTPTTINDIISFVTNDLTSQGSYGLAHILKAGTDGAGTGAPPVITNAIFQGGYDAEAHKITIAGLAAFFNAVDGGGNFINRLREGEGLALGFVVGPVERNTPGALGGRRQALWDLPSSRIGGVPIDNTDGSWCLFNTGREPEKIPGSVPIGKMINGQFVFIDGTIIPFNSIALYLGESVETLWRLLATTMPSGASLIGFTGGVPWNLDAWSSPHNTLPSGTVQNSLILIVQDLASQLPGDDGALRIGADGHTGLPSTGNLPLTIGPESINHQIENILNTPPVTSVSSGGINYRVSENGHTLKDYYPITKDLSVLANAGGKRFAGTLTPTGPMNPGTPTWACREEFMDLIIQPIAISGALYATEPVTNGSANDRMIFNGSLIATRYPVFQFLFPSMQTYSEGIPATKIFTGCIMVRLVGSIPSGGSDGDGLYYFVNLTNAGTYEFQLQRLDGNTPDFSGTNLTSATVTFLNTRSIGLSASSNHERIYHVAEGSPDKLVALPSINVPYLETYYPSIVFGNDAIKGSVHYAGKSIWNPDGPNPRDTDNILEAADKALLSGIENGGAPVDASTNHHHDNTIGIYTPPNAGLYNYLMAHDSVTETVINNNPTFTQILAASGKAVLFAVPGALFPPATPSGNCPISHVIVQVEHYFVSNNALGMQQLSSDYILGAGSSVAPGTFVTPKGTLPVVTPRFNTYCDGTASAMSSITETYILPVGNYFYFPLIGNVWILYHNTAFFGAAVSSNVRMRLVGFIKTRDASL